MAIWQYFTDGIPSYLARHYWWAYLWRPAIWFFDHQPIINGILFGQYEALLKQTLAYLKNCSGPLLQLTCVYGKLTPSLLQQLPEKELYLVDVSSAQLALSRRKAAACPDKNLLMGRMNVESLGLADNSFSTLLVFFLFHELPREARQRALQEIVRVLAVGGQLVVTEYAPLPEKHLLYRFRPSRWLLTHLEPFLDDFWREDILQSLQTIGKPMGKPMGKGFRLREQQSFFGDFYRVSLYEVSHD